MKLRTNIVLTAGLLTYYEQLELFEQDSENLKEYKIEKPLWIFVGSKVVGRSDSEENVQQTLDVVNILIFLDWVLTNTTWFK